MRAHDPFDLHQRQRTDALDLLRDVRAKGHLILRERALADHRIAAEQHPVRQHANLRARVPRQLAHLHACAVHLEHVTLDHVAHRRRFGHQPLVLQLPDRVRAVE